MSKYTVDTIALLAYLTDTLPEMPNEIFESAERGITARFLPSIAMGETLFTILKGKEIFGKEISREKIDLLFEVLKTSKAIEIVCLNAEGWKYVPSIELSGLHDRMIVASHYLYETEAIITKKVAVKFFVG